MHKIAHEIAYDVKYIKNQKLQPGWFKTLKIFILLAVIAAYILFFGWVKAAIFIAVFILLSTVVHFTYRVKTDRFTRSWLDFQVRNENGQRVSERIGVFYYSAVIVNAVIAFAASQILTL